jgi:hypothetical protein
MPAEELGAFGSLCVASDDFLLGCEQLTPRLSYGFAAKMSSN